MKGSFDRSVLLWCLLCAGVTLGRAAVTLHGRVLDRLTGKPVALASVSIDHLAASCAVDQRGRYLFAEVPAGTLDVTAQAPGYRTEGTSLEVPAGSRTAVVDFLLSPDMDIEAGPILPGLLTPVPPDEHPAASVRAGLQTDAVFSGTNYDFGHNVADLALSGPLAMNDLLRYQLAVGRHTTADAGEHRYRVYEPLSAGVVSGRLSSRLPEGSLGRSLAIDVMGRAEAGQRQLYNSGWKYRPAGCPGTGTRSAGVDIDIRHEVTQDIGYRLSVGTKSRISMAGVRELGAEDEDTEGGWGLLRRAGIWQRYLFRGEEWVTDNPEGLTEEQALREMDRSYWLDRDGNPRFTYHDGRSFRQGNTVSIANPHGVYEGLFYGEGDYPLWSRTSSSRWYGRLDVEARQVGSVELKGGVRVLNSKLSVLENTLPWNPNPFWDAYRLQPWVLGGYLKAGVTVREVDLWLGTRMDHVSAVTPLRGGQTQPDTLDTIPRQLFSLGTARWLPSAQLGASGRLSEVLELSCAFQVESRSPGFGAAVAGDGWAGHFGPQRDLIVQSPDAGAGRSTRYQQTLKLTARGLGYVTTSLYYVDVRGIGEVRELMVLPEYRYRVDYADRAKVTGFEGGLVLTLRPFLELFAYVRQQRALAYYSYFWDPPYPFTMNTDQPSASRIGLTFSTPGEAEWGLLGDWSATAAVTSVSGLPYTRTDDRGDRIGKWNEYRTPSCSSVDLLLGKDIRLGKITMSLDCEIANLFNWTNVYKVHPTTGEPDITGREPKPTQFGGGLAVGDDFYHSNRDYNHDGYLTRSEAYASHMRAYRDLNDPPEFYGPPRKIRVGISLAL